MNLNVFTHEYFEKGSTLGSVGDSDNERVSWLLYKREVPPVCIPGATGNKGMKRISPYTPGTRGPTHTYTVHPGLDKVALSVHHR